MSYNNNSLYRSQAQASPDQWKTFIARKNSSQANEIVDTYFHYAPMVDLNPDLALAQACLETAVFTSARWVNENNPAGLGITSDGTVSNGFPSVLIGIVTHLAHLCAYYYRADECPIEHNPNTNWPDARHNLVGHEGISTLGEIVSEPPLHKWANPGNGYASGIVQYANTVLQVPVPVQPTPTPPPVNFPAPKPAIDVNLTHVNTWEAGDWGGRGQFPVRAIVLHVMGGTYDGSISWFHNPDSLASANFCIAHDGRICMTVDPDTQAPWANGIMNPIYTDLPASLQDLKDGTPNANFVTVSIETEGNPFDNDYPWPQERESVYNLMAWLCTNYNLRPTTDTILRHANFDSHNRPNCPGPHWDINAVVAEIVKRMNIPTPVDPNDPHGIESADGQFRGFNFVPGQPVIGHIIKKYWEQNGDLLTGTRDIDGAIWKYGYPLTSEMTETKPDGSTVTCNWCERSRLEWHPEHQGTENEVQEGLLGQEMLLYWNRWSVLGGGAEYAPMAGPERTTLAIDGRIQGYYDQHGGLRHFGYALTPVVTYPGESMIGQWFERAFIEIHDDGLVVGRRLGAEFLETRKSPKGNNANTIPEVS